MKMQGPYVTVIAAAALLISSVLAHADNCAGGSDATGNDCNGREATHSISEANSHMPYLRGAAAMASQKVAQAKQRQRVANDEVKATEAQLMGAIKALSNAEAAEARREKAKPLAKNI